MDKTEGWFTNTLSKLVGTMGTTYMTDKWRVGMEAQKPAWDWQQRWLYEKCVVPHSHAAIEAHPIAKAQTHHKHKEPFHADKGKEQWQQLPSDVLKEFEVSTEPYNDPDLVNEAGEAGSFDEEGTQ